MAKIVFHNITMKPQRHAVVYLTRLRGSSDPGWPEVAAGLTHVCVVSCESTRWLSRSLLGLLTRLGNQLAEGWSQVVFAEITWWLSVIPFVFHPPEGSSRHVLTEVARHMSGIYRRFFKPLLEITIHFLMLIDLSKPHGNSVSRHRKIDSTFMMKKLLSSWQRARRERGMKNWGHQHTQPNNHWNVINTRAVF